MPRDRKKQEKGAGKKAEKPASKRPSAKKGVSSKKAAAKKKTQAAIKKKVVAKKKTIAKKKTTAKKASPEKTATRPESSKEVATKTLQPDLYEDDIFLDEEETLADADMVELLTFSLLKRQYAFRILDVVEILQSQKTTYVPRTRSFVTGVTTVRGKIIPVIDIAGLMGSAKNHDYSKKSKIVVLNGPSGQVGVRMQRKLYIVSLPEDDIQPAPGHLSESDRVFI
ncbi:hypothetical protein LCGC14_1170320 [marine sediment metagenome]|uniref:CheW-like domain-containing protein n=1 Tax=marine sediment metagenome TaxID=412755 RepID=A0A0F9P866_9ZZZZ